MVRGAAVAVAAAADAGFPVVLKVAAPEVVHMTEGDLVRVGVGTPDEVSSAVRDFERELGRADTALVQPVASDVEVALGLVRDPGFGPLVMVAAGGVATDLWDDRVFLTPPATAGDAARAVHLLRTWPLLDGFRGSVKADSSSLACRLVALGQLADDVAQMAELDANPVKVFPMGCVPVDVTVRLAAASGLDAGVPRRLRLPSRGLTGGGRRRTAEASAQRRGPAQTVDHAARLDDVGA